MLNVALTGFATTLSLIFAIGAQNALVLRQGLARSHVFITCLFCATCDAILMALGVAGFGKIEESAPWFPSAMTYGGAAFLIAYAALRLRAAIIGHYETELTNKPKPLGQLIMILAAVTWLNPHVYLDSLALIGAISLKFEMGSERLFFALGAITASFVFFFSLGYGARLLSPIFQSARAWRVLDVGIACVMLAIAAGLVLK